MRILVTGATGCLGGALVSRLIAQGHDVIAQGRDHAAGRIITAQGARFLPLDLRHDFTPNLLSGVDEVHHCAALSTAWGKAADFHAINVTATAHLIDAAQVAGVGKFVFASSPSIYANGHNRRDLTEDAPLPARFATHYAQSKYEAETLVLAADDPNGMRCAAIRPRAIYGKGDRALMPRLIDAIRRGRVPMIAGGTALIDITHVRDAAQAMACAARALDDPKCAAGGQAFNITSGTTWRFSQLLDAVCALDGARPKRIHLSYGLAMAIAGGLEMAHRVFAPAREPILTRQAVVSLGRDLTLDIRRAHQILGYRPEITLDEGITDYATCP